MPSYEYKCNYCSEIFEVKATLTEKAKGLEVFCPRCANQDVQQVFRTISVKRGGIRGASACDPSSGCCCGPRKG